MAKALNTIIVVLDLPRIVPQLIIRVNGIVVAIEEHPSTFPKPTPPLAQVKSNLAALMTAQANYKSSLGSVVTREEARKLTVADAKGIDAYVQGLAVADPEQAEVIAAAASMTIRKTPARHKAPLSVKQLVSMSVKVMAKAVAGGRMYEWEYSLDGVMWDPAPTNDEGEHHGHRSAAGQGGLVPMPRAHEESGPDQLERLRLVPRRLMRVSSGKSRCH